MRRFNSAPGLKIKFINKIRKARPTKRVGPGLAFQVVKPERRILLEPQNAAELREIAGAHATRRQVVGGEGSADDNVRGQEGRLRFLEGRGALGDSFTDHDFLRERHRRGLVDGTEGQQGRFARRTLVRDVAEVRVASGRLGVRREHESDRESESAQRNEVLPHFCLLPNLT